jgi:hypothetical protein
MATNRKRLNESILHVVPSEPTAKVTPNMTIASCSSYERLVEFENHVPSLDVIKSWSADRVHLELGESLFGATVNYLAAMRLIADIKCRLQSDEEVGGCKTWTAYVDKHIRKADQKLPSVIRTLYRKLNGAASNPKHNGVKNRKTKAECPKPSVVVPEKNAEFPTGKGYIDESPSEVRGNVMPQMEATMPTDGETITETFYILRREKDRAISRHDAMTEEKVRKFVGTKNRIFKVEATYVLTAVSE